MLISHSNEFIYVRSQKTASCSLQSFLTHACTNEDVMYVKRGKVSKLKGYNDSVKVIDGAQQMDHASLKRIEQYFPNEYRKYHLITSVRNPWALEFSRYKYIGGELTKKSFENWYCFKRATEKYSIEQYIYNAGLCPINSFVRVDNINDDVKSIVRKLSLPNLDDIDVPFLNKTSESDYRDFYTKDLMGLVRIHNKRMIEKFGYEF